MKLAAHLLVCVHEFLELAAELVILLADDLYEFLRLSVLALAGHLLLPQVILVKECLLLGLSQFVDVSVGLPDLELELVLNIFYLFIFGVVLLVHFLRVSLLSRECSIGLFKLTNRRVYSAQFRFEFRSLLPLLRNLAFASFDLFCDLLQEGRHLLGCHLVLFHA